jgi:hypothetical protein
MHVFTKRPVVSGIGCIAVSMSTFVVARKRILDILLFLWWQSSFLSRPH